MEPLVSVVIPCFNCEHYVEQAIKSIINQTYENMEILIVDDCSTDGTFEILKKLESKDRRIKLSRNSDNLKIVKTLNNLIVASNGKYIARMDADDISDKNRIKCQVYFMENNPGCAICGTNARFIDGNGRQIGRSNMPISDADNRFFMRYYSTLLHPTILARSEVLKNNIYDENYLYAEDYELWCRLIFENGYHVNNVPEILFSYRMVSSQSSVVNSAKQWERSAAILDRYNMVDRLYKDIHKEIFYLRVQNLTPDKIAYIYLVHKEIRKKRMPFAAPVEEKLVYYFHKYHDAWNMFIILFSRLGMYTLIHNFMKKYKMRRLKRDEIYYFKKK